ncbi:GNAT family N-acetyltransferase [Bacteroidota bacterium]
MKKVTFRTKINPGDEVTIREMITSTGFFYEIEVEVAVELAQEKLQMGAKSTYQFIFAEREGETMAYSCYGHIAGTESSFDLYWIVTHNDFRGHGIGRLLLEETHRQIKDQGGNNVVAETSSLEKYQPTRNFYKKMGYHESGFIPDFYKEEDGKLTFVKKL